MIWTERFRMQNELRGYPFEEPCSCHPPRQPGDRYIPRVTHRLSGCSVFRYYFDPQQPDGFWMYNEKPQWMWPMIREDWLDRLLHRRYVINPRWERILKRKPRRLCKGEGWSNWMADVPIFDSRGFQNSYYDLRLVARFAPRPQLPSMWRCNWCGSKVLRRLVSDDPHNDLRLPWRGGCSEECSEDWEKARYRRRIMLRMGTARALEFFELDECRRAMWQTRELLRNPAYLARKRSELQP